jgi:hypothetical protein
LFYSPVHEDEIALNSNELQRTEVLNLLWGIGRYAKPLIRDMDGLEQRGRAFRTAGFGVADAFHLAYAEAIGADFVTCDDELLKRCRRGDVAIWCGTPIDFCKKEELLWLTRQ